MKKIVIALLVIVVIGGGLVFLVASNLDKIVETAIEKAGTDTLGTEVEVGSVSLDLLAGSASIFDFSIANPQGFTDEEMTSFSELSVQLDLQNTSADNIHVVSVVARDPHVYYETRGNTTNVDTVMERLDSGEEAAQEEAAADQPHLVIDSILIENIRGTLQSDRLPAPVDVALGDIRLSDLEGSSEQLVEQIMEPVLRQIAATAAEALARELLTRLSNSEAVQERVQEARDQARDAVDDVRNQAEEALDDVGDLFRRN